MKDINKRQRAEGRGQKFTCSNEDLYPKEISSGGQRFEETSLLRPQKDNPSASCLLTEGLSSEVSSEVYTPRPAFQGASLVNKQNLVTATLVSAK